MRAISKRDEAFEEPVEREKSIDLTSYLDILIRYRWTFLGAAVVVVALGLLYALIASPVYRADVVVQVEESNSPVNTAAKLSTSISPGLDIKPEASAEIELLRSRMVVGKAIATLRLDIEARPRYFPLVGPAIAHFNQGLSEPGLFGWGGYAWGREAIAVQQLDVPESMEDRRILLTATGDAGYSVSFNGGEVQANGKVGQLLSVATPAGPVHLLVSKIDARSGVRFELRRVPRSAAIASLQSRLVITERGRQSGVIGISLEGSDPRMVAGTLNEIANAYVEQNVLRKAAEAEKSLAFLEQQLPQLRQQVETSENRYNAMRNQRGTVDLPEESRLMLNQSVQLQTKLQELRQKRQELDARFTPNHPIISLIDGQIASVNAQINGLTGRIQKLPDVEQNVLRLMRDVKVSTEMLQSLLNDMQQLKLMKASKVGTSRLVDAAEVPINPIRPNREVIATLAVVLGLFAGLAGVILRHAFNGGVADADEIERRTGMVVYTTIPFTTQEPQTQDDTDGGGLLVRRQPDDPAVETLRSFRTALQFALAGNKNRTVVITGPAPGVGKSFICANFSAIAASGKRVVLIDADLRRGSLHRRFGARRTPGLTELLLGAPFEQVVQREVAPGLDFISTGSEPPHAADVLLSPAMENLIDTLTLRYDLVIIDTPPILAATDAGILASKAAAVFLVARAEKTTVSELQASQRMLQQSGADVKGVLLNGLRIEGRWYRAHYYFGKYRYLGEYSAKPAKRA
ncbi:polysaccharide biosynthesis tyrosine autokinase [Cupriavidus consociatus]|uniref:polysaccharide biosynthesis tyrosine autokinase n=1 Tax=Cupriavidus consociatus TaxID=2821357 RepID=UPI001AE6F8D6|nr:MULTISPECIES: polysaccharide biosynthesis tyrosine autokinase [unclassified Cupriavidus]MBP0623531.1 polysaccharide biosynthesis tyrosine autokinase [Cupriavidus sp. LEh25]MDK2660232.1 polysaccharide biosynthesis tyrosine autokinase [Cupriavidus sp. LEh21]